MTSTITRCVNDISAALRTLSELFADPSALTFSDIRHEMERLEEQFKKKATIDAAFAFIAEREEAGRIVGANYSNAYLQQCLDLSKGEAYNRLERGRLLFGQPPAPSTPPASEESTEELSLAPMKWSNSRQLPEERLPRLVQRSKTSSGANSTSCSKLAWTNAPASTPQP